MRIVLALGILVCSVLLGAASSAAAQLFPIALEARGGATLPIGDFASETEQAVDPSVGFEVNAALSVFPGVAFYGAYGQDRFVCGEECELTGEGFAAGMRLSVPGLIPIPLRPWARAGAIIHAMTLDSGGAPLTSDRAVGWEFGAGVTLKLLPTFTLTPGLRIRSYSPDLELLQDTDATYLTADVGLRFGM